LIIVSISRAHHNHKQFTFINIVDNLLFFKDKIFLNFLINVYVPIAKVFLVFFSIEFRAHKAEQILDPYEMSRASQ